MFICNTAIASEHSERGNLGAKNTILDCSRLGEAEVSLRRSLVATLVMTFLMLAFLFAPSSGFSKDLDIQKVTSPGGIEAWLVEDHTVPVLSIQFAFRGAGTVNDPLDKQGLARLVSNTMDEGAADLKSQEFQKMLQNHSITLRYGASRDVFTGTVKTLTSTRGKALALLSLSLTKPRFDWQPLGRMRAANQSRIKSSLSDPNWIAARILNDRIFEGHQYALNSGGSLSSLERVTTTDLKEFHETFLGRNNLVVAVAGDINAAQLSVILDEVFGSLPVVDLPSKLDNLEIQNAGGIFVHEKDIPQTVVEIMQPGIDRSDPDYHTAQVMNFILGSSGFGSRLMREIREKRGLTYGIYSSLVDMEHFDGLGVSTATKNESVGDMLSLIGAEWNKMVTAPPSPEEIQDAQNYLIGSLPLSLTSTDAIAGLMLSLQLDGLPVDYLSQREEAIKDVTPEHVHEVAKRLLNKDKMVTVLVGRPDGIEGMQKIEALPHVE